MTVVLICFKYTKGILAKNVNQLTACVFFDRKDLTKETNNIGN